MESITTKGSALGETATTGASVEVESRSRTMRAYQILESELDSLSQNTGYTSQLYALAGIGAAVMVALYETTKIGLNLLIFSLVVAGILFLVGYFISRHNKSIASRIKNESVSKTSTIK